jgi:hypothetical protein
MQGCFRRNLSLNFGNIHKAFIEVSLTQVNNGCARVSPKEAGIALCRSYVDSIDAVLGAVGSTAMLQSKTLSVDRSTIHDQKGDGRHIVTAVYRLHGVSFVAFVRPWVVGQVRAYIHIYTYDRTRTCCLYFIVVHFYAARR